MINNISILIIVLIFGANITNYQKADKHVFKDLKQAIKNPDDVYCLYLNNQDLKSFPVEIFEFKNLKSLDLSHNAIKIIPDSFHKLTKLDTIEFAFCSIESLPKSISELNNLRHLSLMGNKITTIPQSLCGLDSLYYLNLIGNRIENYHECFLDMKSLNILAFGSFDGDSLPMPREKVYQLWKIYNSKIPSYYWDIFGIEHRSIPNDN